MAGYCSNTIAACMLPSLASLPLSVETKYSVLTLSGRAEVDYAEEVREAAAAAAGSASNGRVRIPYEKLITIGEAAIERFENSAIAVEYHYRKKQSAFGPVIEFLYWQQPIQEAYPALINAQLPFDITGALVLIMAYAWLNMCDAFPELKARDGPKMLTRMGHWLKHDTVTGNADWWLSQLKK